VTKSANASGEATTSDSDSQQSEQKRNY